jgi:hypothetical protein
MGKFKGKSFRLNFVIGDSYTSFVERRAAWIPVRFGQMHLKRHHFKQFLSRGVVVISEIENPG